jgi:hypothetical protein
MDFREWHWAWTGRAKMEGWGPGAASSGRTERIGVPEWQRRGRCELKQARVRRGGASITVSSS